MVVKNKLSKLTFKEIPISEIIPYINNPVIHSEEQIKRVASSISEFGFINPIILDKDNVAIAGHCRIEASKLLGAEKVPCIYANSLSKAQIRAYRIADNKLQQFSEWDEILLKSEIDLLKDEDFNVSLTGFEGVEIPNFDFGDQDEDLGQKDKDIVICPKCGFKWAK